MNTVKKNIRFRFRKNKNEVFAFEFFTLNDLPIDILKKLDALSDENYKNTIFIFYNEKHFRESIAIVEPIKFKS